MDQALLSYFTQSRGRIDKDKSFFQPVHRGGFWRKFSLKTTRTASSSLSLPLSFPPITETVLTNKLDGLLNVSGAVCQEDKFIVSSSLMLPLS